MHDLAYPEAQVLLSRLESDLMAQIVALDRKEPIRFQWINDYVVGVMLASERLSWVI